MQNEPPHVPGTSIEFWEPLYRSAPVPADTRNNVCLEALRRMADHVSPGGHVIVVDHASVAPWS